MKIFKSFLALALCALPVFGQGRYIKSVNTPADMALLNVNDYNTNVWVSGISTANDGGQGIYTYNSASAAATNGSPYYDVVKPVSYSGRWIRQIYYGPPWLQSPTNVMTGNLTDGTIPQANNSTNLIDGPLGVSGGTNVLATGNIRANGGTLTNGLSIVKSGGDAPITWTSGSTNWTIGSDYSDINKFKIAGSSALGTSDLVTIDRNGNVGIGNTAPTTKFVTTGSSGASTGSSQNGVMSITTGTGASTDEYLTFGIVDGSYGWLQAVKPGTAYRNLVLEPSGGNVGIGTTSFGTSAAKVLAIGSGTAPTTSPADVVQLWSADINGTAGRSGLHWRDEEGRVRPLGYQSVTFGSTATLGTAQDVYIVNVNGAMPVLPSAVGRQGRSFTVKMGVTGTCILTNAAASGQTIDGAAFYVLSAQYKYVSVVSGGTNWWITGNN